jgi:hypothetical protein
MIFDDIFCPNPQKLLTNGFDFYEGMRNGLDFYFQLDRIYRIIRIFFASGEGPFGRRPHYPNDPVDPVQLFCVKKESIPLFIALIRDYSCQFVAKLRG